ncbi:hypothetical protein DJ021_01755 [Phenylobacterium hankyongense]|uniref:Uncharacterized protein n=1 Tax=Phenylobacterium hankyongense TaxID=1813876 RepID=A0A328AVI0_9CAUL|nr:hypothetical protein [Phenylobacterium hankyongense]RAK58607.1 hypothetical protein DJ021_01755 [Phenylobacterium hankyongense]
MLTGLADAGDPRQPALMIPRVLVIAVLAGLALAGCASVPMGAPGAWSLQASATAGAALVFADGGRDVLRLACRRSPAELYLASDRLKPAHGEVRLDIDSHRFSLRPTADEPRLAAVGPMPDALPAALLDGGRISVTADGHSLGPLPAPDGKTTAAFVIACRADTAVG